MFERFGKIDPFAVEELKFYFESSVDNGHQSLRIRFARSPICEGIRCRLTILITRTTN